MSTTTDATIPAEKEAVKAPEKVKDTQTKAPKKTEKTKKEAAKPSEDDSVDVGRLDLRVGRIVHVEKHPDAENLYVEKIDLGEGTPRTVISGLAKYVPLDQMQNRLVVCVCNLKPAKMRGIESQAMVASFMNSDNLYSI